MMKDKIFAVIEIGSNNTKTSVYENRNTIYESTDTIEFKKNYSVDKKINHNDLNKLCKVIENSLTYTSNIYVFGCSIFRNISDKELKEVNKLLNDKFNIEMIVVSQNEEALLTAQGCYSDIDYDGKICIFIGGGGSTEVLIVQNKEILEHKYYDFGVVDVTKKFETLKEDIPTCSFNEVYTYVDSLMGDFNNKCDLLILAGGDHLYWYNNARYDLIENTLYKSDKQKYMITKEMADLYDRDIFVSSLNKVRKRSDNPVWFDGSRAMKVINNVLTDKISAKYLIPTKINMEDGLSEKILNGEI